MYSISLKKVTQSPITVFLTTILSVSIAHYILCYIFFYTCIPSGMIAPMYHIFYMGSPFCVTINSIQNYLLNNYVIIWTTGATALYTYFNLKKI